VRESLPADIHQPVIMRICFGKARNRAIGTIKLSRGTHGAPATTIASGLYFGNVKTGYFGKLSLAMVMAGEQRC
jgi:hypothetical protein